MRASGGVVAFRGQVQGGGHDLSWIDAEVCAQHAGETSQCDGRAGEERDRHGHLHADESREHAAFSAVTCDRAGARAAEPAIRESQEVRGRCEAGDQADRHGDGGEVHHDRAVEFEGEDVEVGGEVLGEPHRLRRDPQADEGAQRGQQQALEDEDAHQPPAPGAEGEPYRHLVRASDRLKDEQVGHVHARDEQHAADGPPQCLHPPPRVCSNEPLVEGPDGGHEPGIGGRKGLLETSSDDLEFRPGAVDGGV